MSTRLSPFLPPSPTPQSRCHQEPELTENRENEELGAGGEKHRTQFPEGL